MSSLHGIGWAIVLFYAVCCALRLARFNIESDTARPAHSAPFFTGIPAPAGAGLVMVPMFLSFEWGDWLFRSPYLSAVTVTGIALLMVSKVPTVSLKRIRVPHRWVLPTLLGIGVLAGFVTTAPWLTLTAIGIVYVGSIPLTVRSSYRRRRMQRIAAPRPPMPPRTRQLLHSIRSMREARPRTSGATDPGGRAVASHRVWRLS